MRICRIERAGRRGGASWPWHGACRLAIRAEDPKDKDKAKAAPAAKVSYDKQVRPIFQAHCQGCHQPAKAGRRLRDDGVRPAARRRRVEGGGDRRRASRTRAT